MLPVDPPSLMHPLLAEAALSSSLTTRQVSSFLQMIRVSKPRNLVSCGEYVSFKSSFRNLCYYHQEAGVIENFVARFGLLTADSNPSLHYSPIQALKDWTSKVEILAVVGMVLISCWSESLLRSLFPCKQEIILFMNGFLPRIEDVINPLSFRFKLPLPRCEAVIWTSVFVAMDAIVSGLFI
ncbi:hypothetical protein Bca4012_083178 [Brassica carinata]